MSVAVALASSAFAAPLIPGGTAVPTANTLGLDPSLAGTTLACIGAGGQGTPFATANYAGTLHSCVVQEVGGTLTFYYQIQLNANPAGEVLRFNNTDFSGFTTDVGYRLDGMNGVLPVIDFNQAVPGTQGAIGADRSPNGSLVGFDFFDFFNGSPLVSGSTSYWHYIRTNATQYTLGSTQMIDGSNTTVTTFAPIPEPMTAGLLGLGALALIRRRR